MNFNDFILKKAALSGIKQGSLGTFTSSVKENIKNISLFNSASFEDLENIDIEKLLETDDIDSVLGENATPDQKALAQVVKALLEVDDIKEKADVDGSGKIEQAEALEFLKSAMAFDGDLTNLTMDDLDALVEKMNIDLSANWDEAINEAVQDKIEDVADKATQAIQSSPVGNAISNAASRINNAINGGSSANKNNKTAQQSETPEAIKKQIEEKQGDIKDIEAKAEEEVAEQEKLKEETMKKAGVSDEELKAYKEKEAEIGKQITEKETAIKEKDSLISDKESSVSSNESYISSLASQISANESKLSSISGDDDNAASKKQEINSKISNLKAEQSKKEEENTKLKQEIETAKKEKTTLEQEKQKLEQEKQKLLSDSLDASKGFGKGVGSSEAVSKMKENITNFDSKISEIKANSQKEVAAKQSEIQELEVKLKNAEAAEERTKFLKENTYKAGLGLTGEELAEIARTTGGAEGTTGWCLKGVNDSLEKAYGFRLSYNSAYQAIGEMQNKEGFEDVTSQYTTDQDLANLPAGAMVIWENGNGHEHGHISIALGNGQEASDHIQTQTTSRYGTKYHIFMPVT